MKFLLAGILFLLIGAVLIVKPKFLFDLTESWKNNAAGEPSELYLWSTRFGGVIIFAIGIASMVVFFMD